MAKPKKRPAAKKPVVKKPVVKKPVVKKPVARPVAKKPAARAAAGEGLEKLPPGASEAAFHKFIALARAQKDSAARYRGGALVMIANVERGVQALRGREAELAAHLPKLDRAAMWSTPELALAVGFAARAAQLESPQESALPALMSRIYPLRELLLSNAEGLARAGLLKPVEVAKIRSGVGRSDAVQDCVDLAALYRRRAAALRGKTPITADQLREAAEVGTQALKLLKPARTRRTAATPSEAVRDRDLLYALLVTHHRELRRAGMYLWLDAVDQYVPALLSQEKPPRSKKPPAPSPEKPSPA